MLYKIFYILIKAIVVPLYRVKVHGLENIPSYEKYIVCANHKNILDPIFVASALKKQVHFLAKKELFKNPFLGKLLYLLGAYPVERDGKDLNVLRHSINVLKENKILGLFPEGTRVNEIKRDNIKDGAGFIALKSEANILTIEIISTYKVFRKTDLYIKKPIVISNFKVLKSKEAMAKIMDETFRKMYENSKNIKGN